MAWSLGGDETEVDFGGDDDLVEVDVEAVGEEHEVALGEIRPDLGLEDGGLLLVGEEHHHHVRIPYRVRDGLDLQPVPFCLGPALGALVEPDGHVAAGLLQVQGVGVALAAVAEDRDLAACDLIPYVSLTVYPCHLDSSLGTGHRTQPDHVSGAKGGEKVLDLLGSP